MDFGFGEGNILRKYFTMEEIKEMSGNLLSQNMLRIFSRVFLIDLYAELFPEYDTWTQTIIRYVGEIVRKGDIVYSGGTTITADKEKIVTIPITGKLLSLGRNAYSEAFKDQVKKTAKEIRYENLCLGGWKRFVCGTDAKKITTSDGDEIVIIRCIYGIEMRV